MNYSEQDRKFNARLRAFMFEQIEDTKDNVRLAYVLGARQKAGDTLTQQELDFLQEQEIEKRVLDRLEKMAEKLPESHANRRRDLVGEREAFALLRFFYLVRIAQQGFLPLIANAYPTLEPEAIIYVADKLVAGSMGGISTIRHELSFGEMMKNEARNMARDIIFKLYHESNVPVANGFKTTFKDIMQVAHRIAGQGIYDYQKNAGDYSSAYVNPSVATLPPVYVVLPHMSMVGDPKLSVPAVDSTLPIPGFLLSSKAPEITPKDATEDTASSAWIDPTTLVTHTDTVPPKVNGVATSSSASTSVPEEVPEASGEVLDQTPVETNGHVDDLNATHEVLVKTDETSTKDTEKTTKKKKSSDSNSGRKKSRKSKNDKSKRPESRASQDANISMTTTADHDGQFEGQASENDQVVTAEYTDKNEPQPQQQQQQQQEQQEEDDEQDRFADADLLDDDHEILRGSNNNDGDEETKDTTSTIQPPPPPPPPSDRAAAHSPSQWQNFAAICHKDITDGTHTPLSSKSSTTRSSPKTGRR